MGNKNRRRAVNLLTTLIVLAALFGFIYIAAGAQVAPPGEEYTDRADSSFLLLDSDPSLSVSTELLRQPPSPTPEPSDATPEPPEDMPELTFTPPPADRPSGALTPSPTPGGKSDEPGGDGEHTVPTDLVYFYTSIVNGSTSAVRGYTFTIQHNLEALQQYALTPVSTSVEVNGLGVPQFSGTVLLDNGANTITVTAQYAMRDGTTRTVSKSYTVYYDESVIFEHNLANMTVQSADFSFIARLRGDLGLSNAARSSVMFNGVTITNDTGEYFVTLQPRNNTITLVASDPKNDLNYQQSFVIVYDTSALETNRPTIVTNLDDVTTTNSRRFPLSVTATSYLGEPIYASGADGSGVTVELNGEPVGTASSNSTYELYFEPNMANIVTITAVDREGYSNKRSYEIYCNSVEIGDPIGTATVSVEATTVGLGYLIPPTQVTIYEGVNAVYTLTGLLNQNGFQYNYGGTADAGFYLAYIIRDGITNGAAVPEDLAEKIEEDGLKWNNYSENSLGQFDFCEGSGWMYQVDGVYPTHGMDECFLLDGQVLLVRFTLAYGKDVGQTGGYGLINSYGKEW